jgi:phosphoesterase RecJ-like protein
MTQSHLYRQISEKIRQANRILLVSDGKADGDSIGSTTAMLNWLKREGKTVDAFSIQTIPASLRFLDGAHAITNDTNIFTQPFDLVLTFDASDPARSGLTENLPRMPSRPTVIVFDHHETNPRYGDINAVFTAACSTCEVVYDFFITNDISIDDRMATSLLTGITTDTSSFTNAATTHTGVEAAAHLLKCGARNRDIMTNLIKNASMERLTLWGRALSRLHTNKKLNIATTYILQSDFTNHDQEEELLGGLSNFLSGVSTDTDTILVLHEMSNGTVRGSIRSAARDISKLAKLLGGGGHKKASGFTVQGRIEATAEGPRIIA